MTQLWLIPLRELFRFFIWWVWLIPVRVFRLTKGWLVDADNILVLGPTLRLWLAGEPLFGDRTWQGRIIGFLFRLIRILITVLVYIVILALGLGLTIVWLVLPLLIVISIFNLW